MTRKDNSVQALLTFSTTISQNDKHELDPTTYGCLQHLDTISNDQIKVENN